MHIFANLENFSRDRKHSAFTAESPDYFIVLPNGTGKHTVLFPRLKVGGRVHFALCQRDMDPNCGGVLIGERKEKFSFLFII